jgi:hypothetical protein
MIKWLCCLAVSLSFAHAEQKLVLENDFVRVFDIRVPPGVVEPMHSHARGITIALSDYQIETTDANGKLSRSQSKLGDVRWAEAVTHTARNTGTTEQRVIRIELKQDAPSATPVLSDELDSLVACKDTQKLIFENPFVRAIDDRIPAGIAEPKHRHAHGLTITLADWDSESVAYPSGQTSRRHAVLGEVRWTEPMVHVVRNFGKTESSTIRIELK